MRDKTWLTAEEARLRLHYEPDTGRLIWRRCRNTLRIGTEAKSIDASGYVQVNIGGSMCKGHRLAWLIHHGEWPNGDIDHINGVRNDNRIANLRVVTNAVNCQNKRTSSNKCGLMGVHFHKGAFRAKLQLNRKQIHLGRFATAEEAHAAYIDAKRRLHEGCTL